MKKDNVDRKLVAILVADVVGYSRLMGKDETATLLALQEHQFALINPLIGQHKGRIVKLMGDGILVEFPSVIEAVECAIDIQNGMIRRNNDVTNDHRILFRIGINIGEVITDGDDIYGDGVNIAARLQERAKPNGICISSIVHDQIDGKVEHHFSDAGAQQFKNISKAIRTYQYNPDPLEETVDVAFRPFIDMPLKKKPTTTGGCLCGNVRYEITGEPLGSMLCHCRICQRFSGAPILEGTTFLAKEFKFTKGNPKFYKSSKIAERGFCADCGAPLVYKGTIGYWEDWIVVTTGNLDDPWNYPPSYHLGIESSLPWLKVHDDLPRTSCKDSPSLVEAYNFVGQKVP